MVGTLDCEKRADGSVLVLKVRPHLLRIVAHGLLVVAFAALCTTWWLFCRAVEHLWWQMEVAAFACLALAAILWRFRTGSRGRLLFIIDPVRDVILPHMDPPAWLDTRFFRLKPSTLTRVEVQTKSATYAAARVGGSVAGYRDEETLVLVAIDGDTVTAVRADKLGRGSDVALALHEATGLPMTRTEMVGRAEDGIAPESIGTKQPPARLPHL